VDIITERDKMKINCKSKDGSTVGQIVVNDEKRVVFLKVDYEYRHDWMGIYKIFSAIVQKLGYKSQTIIAVF
jgi:7-cyano-7-deazaguanine synthase in queuosine biosynthesis